MAQILKFRLMTGLDHELQTTQYGFRQKRSTTQAIHCIRRLMERAERTGHPLGVILLDWDKAFDRITHTSLFHSLQRYNIPPKLLAIINGMYATPTFEITLHCKKSTPKQQNIEIRQGCPLSPYLFLVVMSAIWQDIHSHMATLPPRPAQIAQPKPQAKPKAKPKPKSTPEAKAKRQPRQSTPPHQTSLPYNKTTEPQRHGN